MQYYTDTENKNISNISQYLVLCIPNFQSMLDSLTSMEQVNVAKS